MDNLNQTIKPNSIKNGLILGIVLLVFSIISFYFITNMAVSMVLIIIGPIVFSIIIPIVLAIVFCIELRKKAGGYWNFRQAVTGIFIMFFCAYIVQTVGMNLIFAKFIEPNMLQKTEDAMMFATTNMLEKTGIDQTQIDEKKAEILKKFEDQKNVSIGKTILGIASYVIFIFVFALIFAALFKKNAPLIADSTYQDPMVQ